MAIERFRERRCYRRYPVRDGILVSTPSRAGEMLDISMGGLSFRQVDSKELPEDFESAILFGEDELFLEDMPLKPVGDYTQEPLAGYRQIRKIGARFGELTKEQRERLRDFIQVQSR
ncbi:MAG: hypothetical protein M0017_09905 [Desulfobacteraceae bacterium]|nr:hypothetical protein [Desulfobacteraceae bacterium]